MTTQSEQAVLPAFTSCHGSRAHLLERAAGCCPPEQNALAAWLRSEAVHAADAEDLASRTSDIAMSNVQPSYALSTRHAVAVAYEVFPALAPQPNDLPF